MMWRKLKNAIQRSVPLILGASIFLSAVLFGAFLIFEAHFEASQSDYDDVAALYARWPDLETQIEVSLHDGKMTILEAREIRTRAWELEARQEKLRSIREAASRSSQVGSK